MCSALWYVFLYLYLNEALAFLFHDQCQCLIPNETMLVPTKPSFLSASWAWKDPEIWSHPLLERGLYSANKDDQFSAGSILVFTRGIFSFYQNKYCVFYLCPFEPVYSCSALRKTSCKTALHWVKIISRLFHHSSLKLFSEVLLSKPFTRQTWGKMWKTNLVSLHASKLLPGPFSRPPISLIQTPIHTQAQACHCAVFSQKWSDIRRKVLLLFL